MITFIDRKKHEYGVEPICKEMQIAPSTYCAATSRPPSKRWKTDEETVVQGKDVQVKKYGVYGVRKVIFKGPISRYPRHRRALLADPKSTLHDYMGIRSVASPELGRATTHNRYLAETCTYKVLPRVWVDYFAWH